MKRWMIAVLLCAACLLSTACSNQNTQPNIVATTMPVYTFTQALCSQTPLQVTQLVQEDVSCLHDYTLTVRHMQALESADLLVISGGGLEDFLLDAFPADTALMDASAGISLHCTDEVHEHHDHHAHEDNTDPHYWLSPENAKQMASNICRELKQKYPQYSDIFDRNMLNLDSLFTKLENYAVECLSALNNRQIITFHDGFAYMAEAFDLTILKAIEEESGSEASAKELIEICHLVTDNGLPAVFAEQNGSDNAAEIICAETGAKLYYLDMAMSGNDYFEAMYHNINTLKEALE